MESVLGRYRNLIILVAVLFAQVIALGVQVRRNAENESTRLIRIWVVSAVTPPEKVFVWVQTFSANLWHSYFYLRGVRAENRQLKAEIERLRLEQVRLSGDAEQARRLQALLAFKEQFISRTLAAQVIGTGGSEQSRSVYIDKGSHDGIKPDMAVITANGVVGKVLRVFHSTSQVLLINDQSSGVGAILEKTRLQGVLRGTPAGEVVLEKVMSDEQVQPGEAVLTSGGDRVFPKGLPVGTVTRVSQGPELFLNIRVKPAASLGKLEEVLVVTKVEDKEPVPSLTGPVRAVDILAQRLPSVPEKSATDDPTKPPPPTSGLKIAPAPSPPAKPETGNVSSSASPSSATSTSRPGENSTTSTKVGSAKLDKSAAVAAGKSAGGTGSTPLSNASGETATRSDTANKPVPVTSVDTGSPNQGDASTRTGSVAPNRSAGGTSSSAGSSKKSANGSTSYSSKPVNSTAPVVPKPPTGQPAVKALDPGTKPVPSKPEPAGQNQTPPQDSPQ